MVRGTDLHYQPLPSSYDTLELLEGCEAFKKEKGAKGLGLTEGWEQEEDGKQTKPGVVSRLQGCCSKTALYDLVLHFCLKEWRDSLSQHQVVCNDVGG